MFPFTSPPVQSGPWNAGSRDGSDPKRTRLIGSDGLVGEAIQDLIGRDIANEGFKSQHRITTNLRAAPLSMGYTADIQRYSCLFVQKKPHGTGTFTTSGSSVILSLAVLNMILHKMACEAQTEDEMPTVSSVNQEWAFMGVCHTDVTSTLFKGGERELVTLREADYEIANVWSTRAAGGDHLWFVLKPHLVEAITTYSPLSNGPPVRLSNRNAKTGERFKYVMRFEPVVTRTRSVPSSLRVTQVETEITGIYRPIQGFCVHVGLVVANEKVAGTAGYVASTKYEDPAYRNLGDGALSTSKMMAAPHLTARIAVRMLGF